MQNTQMEANQVSSSGEVMTVEQTEFQAKLKNHPKSLDGQVDDGENFVKPNNLTRQVSRMDASHVSKGQKRKTSDNVNPTLNGDEQEPAGEIWTEEGRKEATAGTAATEKLKKTKSFGSLIERNLNTTFANSIENQVSYNNNEVTVLSLHEEDFRLTVGYTTNALTIPSSCYNVSKDLKRLMGDMKNTEVKGYFYIFRKTDDDVRLNDYNESQTRHPPKKCCIVMPLELANNFFTHAGLARKIQVMCNKLIDNWKRGNRKDSVKQNIPSTDVVIFELKTDSHNWTFAYLLTCSLFKHMNSNDYDPNEEPGYDDIRIHLKLASNLPSMKYLAIRNNSESYLTPNGVEVYRSKYGYFSSATDFLSIFYNTSVQKLLELADVQTKLWKKATCTHYNSRPG